MQSRPSPAGQQVTSSWHHGCGRGPRTKCSCLLPGTWLQRRPYQLHFFVGELHQRLGTVKVSAMQRCTANLRGSESDKLRNMTHASCGALRCLSAFKAVCNQYKASGVIHNGRLVDPRFGGVHLAQTLSVLFWMDGLCNQPNCQYMEVEHVVTESTAWAYTEIRKKLQTCSTVSCLALE